MMPHWIDPLGSNTDLGLAAPEDAPLCQYVLRHYRFSEFLLKRTQNQQKFPGLIAVILLFFQSKYITFHFIFHVCIFQCLFRIFYRVIILSHFNVCFILHSILHMLFERNSTAAMTNTELCTAGLPISLTLGRCHNIFLQRSDLKTEISFGLPSPNYKGIST